MATGNRAVRVCIDGKLIAYGQAQLNELKLLRAEVKAELDDADLEQEIKELWADWAAESDAEWICDFYGQQSVLAQHRKVASKSHLIRLRRSLEAI